MALTMETSGKLSPVSGEFISRDMEMTFQAARLPETVRQLRLAFLCSAIFNTLFFISDWRFYGQPHFYAAIPARSLVVLNSLICGLLACKISRFQQVEKLSLLWCMVTALAVSVLVGSHSDLALFVVLLLPLIYILVIPSSFRMTILSSIACSILMLAGYILPAVAQHNVIGLVLGLAVLNCALILVLSRGNRLQRMEWSATRIAQHASEALAASQDRMKIMFKAAPIPLVVTDRNNGRILDYNDAAVAFFGPNQDPSCVRSIDELYVDLNDRKQFLGKLAEQGHVEGFETRIRIADETERNVLLAATQFQIGGAETIMTGAVDISQRKLMESRLEQMATTDPLTGLANRTRFFSIAEAEIARSHRTGEMMAVILLDVDHFKQINDTLGHDAGDLLLQSFAARLKASVRAGDAVARLGGDEFAMMLSGLTDEQAIDRAVDSIMNRLKEPIVYAGRVLECQASFGVSMFPAHAETVEDLLKDADIALYMAKTSGRGRVQHYEPEMRSVMQKRVSMVAQARTALDDDQILPFYQPKVAYDSGRIVGFEALLRWRHPVQGIQPPAKISAAFDDADVAIALSDRMMTKVIGDIRQWLDDGVEFGHIGVNASAAEFRQNNFAERLLERLYAAGVPNDRLELEVTETVFLGRGAEYVERALHSLSKAGVRIALDDFGTGYASLSHLKQFPVDIIKIDRSFVRDLEDDPDDAAIIRAVLNLGHSLGIGIVAEGIENVAQARYLAEQGCDFGQGYLFGRPTSAEHIPVLLRARAGGGNWWIDNSTGDSWAVA